jgi:hypothetical protein
MARSTAAASEKELALRQIDVLGARLAEGFLL